MVAYQSTESGWNEVYVRPFLPPGESRAAAGVADVQWQVSTSGGVFRAWRPDGKALYYLNPAGAMMAAPFGEAGSAVSPGAPVVLFSTRVRGGGDDIGPHRQYDVAPDGRFLINTVVDDAASPITLIQHWTPPAK